MDNLKRENFLQSHFFTHPQEHDFLVDTLLIANLLSVYEHIQTNKWDCEMFKSFKHWRIIVYKVVSTGHYLWNLFMPESFFVCLPYCFFFWLILCHRKIKFWNIYLENVGKRAQEDIFFPTEVFGNTNSELTSYWSYWISPISRVNLLVS